MCGKYTDHGYVLVKDTSHPFRRTSNYVMKHRWVMEQFLSKKYGYPVFLWPKIWNVHHINGIKDDNRIENLQLLPIGDHTIHHMIGRRHSEETKQRQSIAHKGKKKGRPAWNKGMHTNCGGGVKKGHVPWNKGKTGIYSEETLKKMRKPKRRKSICV